MPFDRSIYSLFRQLFLLSFQKCSLVKCTRNSKEAVQNDEKQNKALKVVLCKKNRTLISESSNRVGSEGGGIRGLENAANGQRASHQAVRVS